MTKLLTTLFSLLFASSAVALPTSALVEKLSAHVVKVQVALNNGSYSVGSGVVVAQDQVITNCHVIANARSIGVLNNGEGLSVSAIKPDWKHDLCMLKVEGLQAPVVHIGSSQALQYEQPVFTVGYPNNSPKTVSTYGYVKGLYPMDDSVIVRTTSAFRLGASGGGVFDDVGNLVAIITLKSPGKNPLYYNMSVEWVKALLNAPEQSITASNASPFWDKPQAQWPFFMRVVKPLQTEHWDELLAIATEWTAQEPNTNEAWFYLAVAEHGLKQTSMAEAHFQHVVDHNSGHSEALYYLGMIATENGKRIEALDNLALLQDLDDETAEKLMQAMRLDVNLASVN